MPDSMGFVLSKDGQKGQPSGPHAAAAACRAAEAACRAAEAACRAAEAACRAAEAACRAAEVACRAAEAACRAAEAACRAAEAACRAAEAASDAEDAAAGKFNSAPQPPPRPLGASSRPNFTRYHKIHPPCRGLGQGLHRNGLREVGALPAGPEPRLAGERAEPRLLPGGLPPRVAGRKVSSASCRELPTASLAAASHGIRCRRTSEVAQENAGGVGGERSL
eukprot:gene15383-biopygen3235